MPIEAAGNAGDNTKHCITMNFFNIARWPTLAWVAVLVLIFRPLPVDAQGAPTLSVNDVSVTEGNSGIQYADFTVTLSGASASTVEVTYAIIDGTANRFTDFTPAAHGGILRFPPGTTQQIVTNHVRGDTLSEAKEVFYLQLYFPVNATLLRDRGVCTILNDDGGYTSVFAVTNTAQTGPGSLRQAILNANTTPQRDLIIFDIGLGGRVTISPTNPLPTITSPVIIDGTTQSGYDGRPTVSIDGTRRYLQLTTYGPIHGLLITCGDCELRGLAINGWRALIPNDTGAGSGLYLKNRGSNVVRGCHLGIDATGRWAVSNGVDGLSISNSSFNVIGGVEPWMRNVISGNMRYGIYIQNGSTNQILGNYIGTDATGTTAVGNRVGMTVSALFLRSEFNTIGGGLPGAGNVISGNRQDGVALYAPSSPSNVVVGNIIGLDSARQAPLGNGLNGVTIASASNCRIGGPSVSLGGGPPVAEANSIGHNGGDGILITGPGSNNNLIFGNTIFENATNGVSIGISPQINGGNAVVANSISRNGLLGIDLLTHGVVRGQVTFNDALDADTGPNGAQNFPENLGFALNGGLLRIIGTLNSRPSRTYRLDFYRNSNMDPSGYGEGASYVGTTNVTTSAAGTANFNFSPLGGLPAADFVTATATDADGSTSEFSAAVRFAGFPTLSVANASITEGDSGWKNLIFAVTLLGPTPAPVAVDFATADGTALSGPGSIDYQAVSGRLSFPAGPPTPIFISVPIRGELLQEADDVFYLNLSNPVNAFLPSGPATGTILDDDTPLRIVVTSAAGSGPGSLAQAIQTANGRPGLDFITFSPALATINVTNPLPDVTDPLNINGLIPSVVRTGQVRRIELSGPRPGGAIFPGLRLAANDCTVRGMVINNFNGPGIHLFRSTNSVIATNNLGTDRAGTGPRPNSHGVLAEESESVVIGGASPAEANLISGNDRAGVFITNSTVCQVTGNKIGTDAGGNAPLPNEWGVELVDAPNNQIGGYSGSEGNLISGNRLGGIRLSGLGTAVNNIVGNRIGTDAAGAGPLRNGASGVRIESLAQGNAIGFSAPPTAGNVIAYNLTHGVEVANAPDNRIMGNRIFQNGFCGVIVLGHPSTGAAIVGNSIHGNGQLGINLQPFPEPDNTPTTNCLPGPGPNNLLPMPVNLAVADCNTNTDLTGTLCAPLLSDVVIHLYASGAPDPSGHGEGESPIYQFPSGPLVEVSVPAGATAFSTNFAGRFPNWHFTATTFNPLTLDTSEFSRAIESLPMSIQVVGPDVHISFNTVSAVGGQLRTYQVQHACAAAGPWTPVPGLTVAGTGQRMTLVHPNGTAGCTSGFYRVICL